MTSKYATVTDEASANSADVGHTAAKSFPASSSLRKYNLPPKKHSFSGRVARWTHGALRSGRSTRHSLPSQLSPDYVARVFNSRARERNTDETVKAFLTAFKDAFVADNATRIGLHFPQSLFDAVVSQAETTLRFGQLDLDRVPRDELTLANITTFAQVIAQVPIIRTILVRKHHHLSNDRVALTFVEVMEMQLAKWTTMVPPAVSRRRNRAKILMQQNTSALGGTFRARRASLGATQEMSTRYQGHFGIGSHSSTEAARAREEEACSASSGTDEPQRAAAAAETPSGPADGTKIGADFHVPNSDIYSGKTLPPDANGMPVFFLQEIKFADSSNGAIANMAAHFQNKRDSVSPATHGSLPSFNRRMSRRSMLARKKASMSRRSSDALSEQSKMMVLANSVLEARRLFHDFDANKDGHLEPREVHSALRDLGLIVSNDESARLLTYLDIDCNGSVSEGEFIAVVSYRVRSAVVRSTNKDKLSGILPPKDPCLLHPLSNYMQAWDLLMVFLLIAVSFLTPFEVAFVQASSGPPYNFWFVFNRVIDIFFIKDCLIHFILMQPKHDVAMDSGLQWTVTWERNRKNIAMSYLKGWFWVDVLSCVPFDVISVFIATDGAYANLRLLRIVRLLRIAKLLKILDGGRQFKRFERWLSLRHTVAETVGVVVTMAFCAHWTACLWMLIVALERDVAGFDHSHTWVSEEGFDTLEYRVDPSRPWPLDPFKMYSVCLYWSMQTLTTIGYGGTASPTNQAEYVVASFAMMAGSILWAYLIGKISTLMHFLSQTNMEHHQRLDQLESFIEEKHLSPTLAHRLRRYFLKRRSLDKMETYQVLLNHMSPTLRGDVAEAMTGKWLHRVSWLRNAQRTFVTSLAMLMRPEIYPPMEMITGETFHVVARGVVIKDMKILCSGMVWGLDMILTNKSLRRMRPAIALTYVEVLELRRGDLLNLLSRFPKARKRVRKAVIWLAFQRKFLAHAREIEMLTTQVSSLLLKEVGSRAKVRECFSKYDSDGDGWINCREFSDSLRDLGFNARSEIVDALVSRFDSDNDGKISLSEFFAFFDRYSKSSSRLLFLKSKKNLLSIGSKVEHRVVDKEHGLNMDDDGGSESGDSRGVERDAGVDDDRRRSRHQKNTSSHTLESRAASAGSLVEGDESSGAETVHLFSEPIDLGSTMVSAEEVNRMKVQLTAQMQEHHDILHSHLQLIARKLNVRLIDREAVETSGAIGTE